METEILEILTEIITILEKEKLISSILKNKLDKKIGLIYEKIYKKSG